MAKGFNKKSNGSAAAELAANRPKISMSTVKRLLHLIIKKYKLRLFFVVICIITASIVNVSSLTFIQTIIDDFIEPLLLQKQNNPDIIISFAEFASLIAKMMCLYLVGTLASFLYARMMVNVSQGSLKQIRDTMFSKMQKLPIRYFDTHKHGDIMTHYTNDTDALEQMIAQSLPNFVSSAITIITVLIAMFRMSWQMTLFVLAFVVFMLFITKAIASKSGQYFIGMQNMIGTTNGYIEEMINGQKVVKVFNHEDTCKKEFDKLNEELCENAFQANRYSSILMPTLNNLGNIEYGLLGVFGAYLCINNIVPGLTIGAIASFLALMRAFNGPIRQVSNQVNSIVMALAGATRIFELIDEEPEVDDGYVTLVNAKIDEQGNIEETKDYTGHWAWKNNKPDGDFNYIELKGDIRFENVNFGYELNKEVLHDISLYAKPGQKIAFVGATGAGKTTITNLINRFYDVTDGIIKYDGININTIKKSDLRLSLGLVLQDTNLFTGTIKDNIKYGNMDATDEEVIQAAKIANAHGFIERLPDGYDTKLTDNGSQLSQGQRQLIAIARCSISNPPVMILDEATSSIDTRTEKIVQDGMDKLMENRTVFVIAHRLSTVRNSKAIMVLEHGKIIERGDHEDLLAQKGEYYELYTGAFELE